MQQLTHKECQQVAGSGVIVVVGGAFLLGVVGGYIAKKVEKALS